MQDCTISETGYLFSAYHVFRSLYFLPLSNTTAVKQREACGECAPKMLKDHIPVCKTNLPLSLNSLWHSFLSSDFLLIPLFACLRKRIVPQSWEI